MTSSTRSAASSSSAIAAERLTVRRGGTEILHAIDLAVPKGTVTGLIGPSGCGKTTLMRSILGLQRLTSGSLDVLGLPAGTPALRSRTGYMAQEQAVYPDLTVRENVRFFARLTGHLPNADDVIETVDLTRHANRSVKTLSGGEQSRVSLASALVSRPELLILDEPTVGIDPVLRVALWSLFRELAASGTTLLVSSHIMDEADRCNALILMRDGDVIATGTPSQLRERTDTDSLEDAFLAIAEAPRAS